MNLCVNTVDAIKLSGTVMFKEIDYILLDMVMPEMDGEEKFFAMKEVDPTLKVIL